jgi:SprB repeat/Secretion system C-terminal sorting domain
MSGGISPYTYSWSGGGTDSAVAGLTRGTYTVNVWDNNGCMVSDTLIVAGTGGILASAQVIKNVSCYGGIDGTASLSVSGGTLPYTYQWNSGTTSTNATNSTLSAGNYVVTIGDSSGCAITIPLAISQPPALAVYANITTNIGCNGVNTGSATVNVSNLIVAHYSYKPAVQHFIVPPEVTTITVSVAGASGGNVTYTTTVTGGNGALFSGICQPVIPGDTISVVVGGQGGSIDSAESYEDYAGGGGGGGTYVYDSNQVGAHTGTPATTYLYAVAAGGGGAGGLSQYLTQSESEDSGASAGTDVSLNATTASMGSNMGGTGGNGGVSYTFLYYQGGAGAGWISNGGSAPYLDIDGEGGFDFANQFAGGSYYSQAGAGGYGGGGSSGFSGGGGGGYNGGGGGTGGYVDADNGVYGGGGGGSFLNGTLINTVKDSIVGNGFVTISCVAPMGAPPYTYLWSPGGQTNQTATGLSEGTYTITVTDNNGCTSSDQITITPPPALSLTADSISATTGSCDGSAWANVNGGIAPYTYSWTGGPTSDTITNQCAGYYCCTITDAGGCIDSVCTNIETTTGTNEVKGKSEKVKVFPNPNDGVFTLELSVVRGQWSIEVYNILGENVYLNSYQPPAISYQPITIDLSNQPNGVYFYRVLYENGGLIGEGKVIIDK